MSAVTLGLLKELEDFMTKDLSTETLTKKSKNKVKVLLGRITECMRYINEQEKLDQFLTQLRRESQGPVVATKADKAISENESCDNFYMDLSDEIPDSHAPPTVEEEIDGADSDGSGSVYESYDSDGELPNRAKLPKDEEDLNKYFTKPEYSVFSYIYTESVYVFKWKTWNKRVGVVKEKNFLCYEKTTDATAITSFPLGAYNCSMKKKKTFVLVSFSEMGGDEYYRFYIDRELSFEWARVLKDATMSFKDETLLIPPPVASRPYNTLPAALRGPPPPPPANRHGPIQMAQSAVVAGLDIGKGLRTAMTDIFKKDKTKKRMMTAENLGSDICGSLSVFDNKWNKKWCLIRNNELSIYGKDERLELQLQLSGCTLLPVSENPAIKFAFKILKDEKEVAFMEANSNEEMDKWVSVLTAAMEIAPSSETDSLYLMPLASSTSHIEKDSEATSNGNDEDGNLDLNRNEMPLPKTLSSPKPPDHTGTGKDEDGEIKGVQNRDKKKREKRSLTAQDITLPMEVTQMPEIKTVERTLVNVTTKSDNKSDVENGNVDIEKRMKELRLEKADIKTRLLSLSVRKNELRKNIKASSSDKEREKLKMLLQEVTDEYNKLEMEDVEVRCELGRLEHGTNDATSHDDKASEATTTKEQSSIESRGKKGVLARAQTLTEEFPSLGTFWTSLNSKLTRKTHS